MNLFLGKKAVFGKIFGEFESHGLQVRRICRCERRISRDGVKNVSSTSAARYAEPKMRSSMPTQTCCRKMMRSGKYGAMFYWMDWKKESIHQILSVSELTVI